MGVGRAYCCGVYCCGTAICLTRGGGVKEMMDKWGWLGEKLYLCSIIN